MNEKIRVVPIRTLQEFSDIREGWNQILRDSATATTFLTWEWLYTWAEIFCGPDRQLFLLAIYEKSKLIGIAPWCIRYFSNHLGRIRRIEFLGLPETSSDYLDVIIKKGKEITVAHSIYSFFFGAGKKLWDSVFLQDIPSESRFLVHFLERIREDGKYVALKEGAYCPLAVLPGTWNAFIGHLSSNRRQQFRRHYRLLEKHGNVNQEIFCENYNSSKALDRFYKLYRKSWGKKADKRFFEFVTRVTERFDSKGLAQFNFLVIDGKDIAALLHFSYRANIFMYLMAVDKTFTHKFSIGNILVGLSIEDAISKGMKIYDFLRGVEEYKFHWADCGRRAISLALYQKKMKLLPDICFAGLKDLVRILVR